MALKEARSLGRLTHANVVHVFDVGQVDAALADLVSAYCAANPDLPLKPYEIARGITAATGRHLGTAAVLNCCLLLTSTGRLAQVALPAHPAGAHVSVQEAVLARVARLEERPRRVVEGVSIAPRSLKIEHAAALVHEEHLVGFAVAVEEGLGQ